MDINAFRAELETRLLIEKEYIIQELDSIKTYQERIELLPKFNKKYKLLIKRLADEEGLDLNALYQKKNDPKSKNLSNGQVILGVTMNIYDQMADDLYERIADTE
ncbi:hypothetical protein SAMN05421856_10448 [Chryseobacterium taichungense]|uniref:Uncharacterized protein n=1 Tax=Chryseobacterium taichungense TaxID=295069 RepID=A0A1H7Z7E2_9FLAO|nr:hypothetical protein [Chryseobacterium taichungense]SEM53478.1 hypothetical protein SAMN05421856_10448 [Chryseobacterium taichungense]